MWLFPLMTNFLSRIIDLLRPRAAFAAAKLLAALILYPQNAFTATTKLVNDITFNI